MVKHLIIFYINAKIKIVYALNIVQKIKCTMKKNILTPVQLWKKFKPTTSDFNTNIVSYKSLGYMSVCELYFTALREQDGDVRVYTQVYFPKNPASDAVVIMVPEFNKMVDINYISYYVQAGFNVVTFDIAGLNNTKHFTRYPKSLAFCNYAYSGEHLNTCNFGAENTCLFNWCKITRQVISFVKNFSPSLTPSKVLMTAQNSGANILWQVAGVDDRLDGIIPINNTGYDDFNSNLGTEDIPLSELAERNVWSLCCAAPSYAKFINCPVLFLGSSNNRNYSYSSLSDTLKLIPEDITHYECVSVGCSNNLYKQALYTAFNWIDDISNNKKTVIPPKGRFVVLENRLWVYADFDMDYDSIVDVKIHVTYGKEVEGVRNWIGYTVHADLVGTASQKIKVYDLNEEISLICSVFYRNGSMYTSPLLTIKPNSLGEDIKTNARNSRMIFDKDFGTNAFYPRETAFFADKANIHFETGALGLEGITTDRGDFVCYNIDGKYITNNEVMLQFDYFTTKPRKIVVEIEDVNLKSYYAKLELPASNEWQSIKIPRTMFVSNKLYPIKTWNTVKSLIFSAAEKVLINNIIWI